MLQSDTLTQICAMRFGTILITISCTTYIVALPDLSMRTPRSLRGSSVCVFVLAHLYGQHLNFSVYIVQAFAKAREIYDI